MSMQFYCLFQGLGFQDLEIRYTCGLCRGQPLCGGNLEVPACKPCKASCSITSAACVHASQADARGLGGHVAV